MNWKQFFQLPYLELWLDIGILQFRTELLTLRYETECKDYIVLQITICHKWGFSFKLYQPWKVQS